MSRHDAVFGGHPIHGEFLRRACRDLFRVTCACPRQHFADGWALCPASQPGDPITCTQDGARCWECFIREEAPK